MPNTWGGRSTFAYQGSVNTGTDIIYGNGRRIQVSAAQYAALRANFKGRIVPVGASRTDAQASSLGAWLQAQGIQTAIASYVASILLLEGCAQRTPGNEVKIM